MIRFITSLVQLALFVPVVFGMMFIYHDIKNGGLKSDD